MSLMGLDLARQVGRWWASAAGLLFVEADASTPGSVYAAPLPPRTDRQAAAASITLAAAAGPGALDEPSPTSRFVLVVEAHADAREDAERMLARLRALVRPGEKPFRSARTRGVIGAPPASAFAGEGDVAAWRVLGFEVVSEVQGLRFVPGDGSPDGQSSATLTVAPTAVPAVLRRAFDVANADAGLASATVEITETSLILTTSAVGAGDATIALAGKTIAQLATAVAAVGGGWGVTNQNNTVDGVAATSLIGFEPASAKGAARRLVVMTG